MVSPALKEARGLPLSLRIVVISSTLFILRIRGSLTISYYEPTLKNELTFTAYISMDQLPTTHVLTKEEKAFIEKLDTKGQELHELAVKWLQTSYRPEWSHMWPKSSKK
jgi:hypothetical protein